jgi:hypothetical protein
MNVNYAVTKTNRAALATDFGRGLAQMWFGLNNDILEAMCGTFVRGKNKGKLRGEVVWEKVERGGWSIKGGHGHVEFPGIKSKRLVIGKGWNRTYTEETLLETSA